jgi:predicted O-methyltransferase YrrM
MGKYSMIDIIKEWLKFYARAETIFDIHSPYFYEAIKSLYKKDFENSLQFRNIQSLKKQLQFDQSLIPNIDYGAGSRSKNTAEKSIASIAKTASSSYYSCSLLYNLAAFLRPKQILELGTNLGIGSACMAAGWGQARIDTIEGNPHLVEIANKNINLLEIKNITIHEGKFSEILPKILKDLDPIDLLFVDGHHNGEATLEYIEMLMPNLSEKGVIILDDIYWSSDMTLAFQLLTLDPMVGTYIDLFSKGILFLDPKLNQTKGLSYVNFLMKPWRLGIWGGKI